MSDARGRIGVPRRHKHPRNLWELIYFFINAEHAALYASC
jgi:hypothetical protein